jgi:hypothetical protein
MAAWQQAAPLSARNCAGRLWPLRITLASAPRYPMRFFTCGQKQRARLRIPV